MISDRFTVLLLVFDSKPRQTAQKTAFFVQKTQLRKA